MRWLLACCLVLSSVAAASAQQDVLGQWDAPHDWGFRVVHAGLIPTKDRVIVWGYSLNHSTVMHEVNPFTFETEEGTGLTSSFCAGNEQLADGSLFVVGGVGENNESGIYDLPHDEWRKLASMNWLRYYPSATTLGDGRVLVTGGNGGRTNTVEIYDPASNSWDSKSVPPGPVVQSYYYPRVFLLPDGKLGVIYIWGPSQKPYLYDFEKKTWEPSGTPVEGGPTAHYLPGKILIAGHDLHQATAANRATRLVDFTTHPDVTVRTTAPKAFNSEYNNLTILPTGKVLSFGGRGENGHGVFAVEQWDPDTEVWSTLATMKTPIRREYHSIAVLLRDGRVLTGGGEPRLTTAEIYNPPYLYRGARPIIVSAPSAATYGSTFQVTASGGVQKISLIRIGAVTHANNWGQRFMWLNFKSGPNGQLTVSAPPDAYTAPPGYYLLYVLNADGVPSVGGYLKIQRAD